MDSVTNCLESIRNCWAGLASVGNLFESAGNFLESLATCSDLADGGGILAGGGFGRKLVWQMGRFRVIWALYRDVPRDEKSTKYDHLHAGFGVLPPTFILDP